jgi:hypothetical protein
VNCHASDTAPAALTDLIAAGLVSHEVIGDPARLGAEAETLRALCGVVAGPVWRIDAFHYAFRARAGDLGGRLAGLAADDWSAALEAALQGELGPEAVWVSPVDILAGGEADLDQPLLLLRAQAEAVSGTLEAVPAGLQAIINARYAGEVARLTAAAETGQGSTLDARLAAIEARQARILERLDTHLDAVPPADVALARLEAGLTMTLNTVLEEVLRRLDAQEALLRAQAEAQADLLASRPAAAGQEAFQETIGLTLAEFLARLETQGAPAGPRLLS